MKVAVVGATGLVGAELIKVLNERLKLTSQDLSLYAGRARPEQGIKALSDSWSEMPSFDVIFNATEDDVALELAKHLTPKQLLIDNSSAFRMNPDVPLIVPEVNPGDLKSKTNIVANPNCTACLLTVALAPLKTFGIKRVVVSTYQAASGAGILGLQELEAQTLPNLGSEVLGKLFSVFKFPLMGNVMSHNTRIHPEDHEAAGYNGEEWKVIGETRKILNLPDLWVSSTCVRVPVKRAHAEAVTVDLDQDISLDQLRTLFRNAPGVKVVDNWKENHFPMPLEAEHQDLILVGRLRKDATQKKTVHLFLAGDQLRKGAATNAVQIWELALKNK